MGIAAIAQTGCAAAAIGAIGRRLIEHRRLVRIDQVECAAIRAHGQGDILGNPGEHRIELQR